MSVTFQITVEREHFPQIGMARFRYYVQLPHLNAGIQSTDRSELLKTLEQALVATEHFVHEREGAR